ncbi:hypothetical protein D3C76_534930 [compost metagenome]
MSLYETNLSFLSEYYPSLIDLVNNEFEPEYPVTTYLSRNNEPNLLFEINGQTYSLHSRYNAQNEAKRWVESISDLLIDKKHVLISGIGLGYYLEEILAHTDAKDIYIYEPSIQIFKEWVNSRDVTKPLSDPRVRGFAVGRDEFIMLYLVDQLSLQLSGSFVYVSPPIYQILYPEFLDSLKLKIEEGILQQISNMQTLDLNQDTWLTNVMYNLPHILLNPSISDLKDLWRDQDVKAIVVGSGPSLKKDIKYLEELKKNCLIIAAGSSIQAFKHYGVHPHFVVSIDGSEGNCTVFDNIDTSEVPLIFSPQLYYKITDNYKNKIYSCLFANDSIIQYITDYKDMPEFISTATVTGTAIQIAAYMGITEIILMGQDLSYPDEEYYAPGVNHVSDNYKNDAINESDLLVPNVEGGFNRTKGNMQVLLNDLQVLMELMNASGVKVINTSKKGAVIKGTEWVSMDELYPILKKSDEQAFDISSYIISMNPEIQNIKLIDTIKKLETISKAVIKMELRLKQLLEQIEILENRVMLGDSTEVIETLHEIDKQWQWVTQQDVFEVFYKYSLRHAINIYMRYISEIVETEDPIRKGELINNHLKKLVIKLIEFTPEMQSIFRKTIEKTREFTL